MSQLSPPPLLWPQPRRTFWLCALNRSKISRAFLTGDQVTTWQNFQNEQATRMQNRINKLSQASP